MTRGTLLVFAKAPEAGRVKTRLAGALGEAGTVALARALLQDTWARTEREPHRAVLVVDGDPARLPSLGDRAAWTQGGGDLGARLERGLRRALAGSPWAIALGTDSPDLPPETIALAVRALDEHDAVLGPCEDGGYYLLGLRACPEGLLDDLPWSSERTCVTTLERLRARGLTVATLPTWYDVDRPADLARLRASLAGNPAAAPRTALVVSGVSLSVIIPTLNEAARIERRLGELAQIGVLDVIVADGGSTDATVATARAHGSARVVSAPRGRAAQMNAGAREALGRVLLFLHADVSLPGDAPAWIERALADPSVVGGAFRTWTVADEGERWAPWLHVADLRSRYTRAPYGDQALFVRSEAFARVGGYPDQPLMEDVELARRLRRLGRLRTVPARVRVSGRRFLAHPVRDTVLVTLTPLLYRLGVSPARLRTWYHDVR